MEVLLLTDEADLESALPELESFAQSVQRAPLDDPGAAKGADADVAIIDARADLAAARRVCRRLTTSAPALGGCCCAGQLCGSGRRLDIR